MLYFQHKPHFLSTWLDPNRAAGLRSKRFNGKLALKTNHAEDETGFSSYLEGELSDVCELVTLKQSSGGVLEDGGGDAVN